MAAKRTSQTQGTRFATVSGLLCLGLFVAILTAEHFLRPGLSPLTHQISEYANHRDGWLMRMGFVAWAVSLTACTVAQSRRRPASLAVRLSAALFLLAGAAFILTATFNTETVAGRLPLGERLTTSGRLHDLGSGVATLALAGAAVADACARPTPSRLRRLAWAVVICAVASDVALLVVGPSVGGLRERILVGLCCFWQTAFLCTYLSLAM